MQVSVEKVLIEQVNQKLINVIQEWKPLVDKYHEAFPNASYKDERTLEIERLRAELKQAEVDVKDLEGQNLQIKKKFVEYRQHVR